MKKFAFAALPFMMLLMGASDPQGFTMWKAQDLKAYTAKLAPKMNADKIATEKLADHGGYNMQMAHREASGVGELHEKWVDLFVVQSGEASLVVGGSIEGGHETGPGEIRGASVTGGERHRIAAGDVVHIPANTPHQMLVEPGKHITYFVVKIENHWAAEADC